MRKTKARQREVGYYTIRGTNKVVKAGDCVLMRPQEKDSPPYVARVEKIEADNRNNVRVRIRWYYRPEESVGGRREFHGAKELLLSDHYDIQSASTIEGKCTVHTFEGYTNLDHVRDDDYYYRFEYRPASGLLLPTAVLVCELPYNPDELMMQCEECDEWYDNRKGKTVGSFVCHEHTSDVATRKPLSSTLPSNGSPKPKRQRK